MKKKVFVEVSIPVIRIKANGKKIREIIKVPRKVSVEKLFRDFF